MYLFYCDESNLEAAPDDFIIYGGLVIPGDKALRISAEIESIRKHWKLPAAYQLKFNPKPDHLNHEEFKELKEQVLRCCAKNDVRFIVSMILSNIATSPGDARLNEINRVLYHFDKALGAVKDFGLVLIDRFTDKVVDEHIRKRFSVGLTGMPYSQALRLQQIVGIHYSAIGQSHYCSMIDIVIGSFRHAINTFTRQQESGYKGASTLLKLVSPLFFRHANNKVSDFSLFFSPRTILKREYFRAYCELKDFLRDSGIEASQNITNERTC